MSTRSSIDGAFAAGPRGSASYGFEQDLSPGVGIADCACAFTCDGRHGTAYNEAAFRYFLDIERKRAETSNQRFILLLVELKQSLKAPGDAHAAQKLMAALAGCVRETDFVGWYQAGVVAGAVLTEWAYATSVDSHDAVSERVARALGERLPSSIAASVRVRLYESPGTLPNVS